MGFIRIVVFGFIALSVIYLSVAIYARSVCRERLEDEFDREHPDGGEDGARDAYVDAGIVAYNNSIRPKLIGLVYVIPIIVISIIVYVINTN